MSDKVKLPDGSTEKTCAGCGQVFSDFTDNQCCVLCDPPEAGTPWSEK